VNGFIVRPAAAAALVLLALGACGRTHGAIAIPQDEIPFTVARSSQPEPPTAPRAQYPLSFVRRGHLITVSRNISSVVPAESVLVSLLRGPSQREREGGITTAIPTEARLLQVAVAHRIAEVNLSREFQSAGSSQSVLLRVAQVVRTVTSVRGIDSVVFLIDGVRVDVPTDRGVVERAVSAPDYASVAPA
jgi:hypothetical protein